MPAERIQASKILQPMQLFAAFLVALIVLEGSILTAARFIEISNWASAVLVIAAICIIPLFLFAPVVILKLSRGELLEGRLWVEWQKRVQDVASQKVEVDSERVSSFIQECSVVKKESLDELFKQIKTIDKKKPILLTLELPKKVNEEAPSNRYEDYALDRYIKDLNQFDSFKGIAILDDRKKIQAYFPRSATVDLVMSQSIPQLTKLLNSANFEEIKRLSGVVVEFLTEGTSNVDALAELIEKNLDSLVVQGRGKLKGIVDRQDLMAKIVLAIAGSGNVTSHSR